MSHTDSHHSHDHGVTGGQVIRFIVYLFIIFFVPILNLIFWGWSAINFVAPRHGSRAKGPMTFVIVSWILACFFVCSLSAAPILWIIPLLICTPGIGYFFWISAQEHPRLNAWFPD